VKILGKPLKIKKGKKPRMQKKKKEPYDKNQDRFQMTLETKLEKKHKCGG